VALAPATRGGDGPGAVGLRRAHGGGGRRARSTWIGGLYDGGDGDEAAALVWDHGSAVVPAGIALLAILAALVVAAPPPAVVARFSLGAPCPRAPPRA